MKNNKSQNHTTIRYIDLFAGIGGFRCAMQNAVEELGAHPECVFTSEIDNECQNVYKENFGDIPHGDIIKINAESIPK